MSEEGPAHERINHTGDMALLVHAKTLPDLYDAAAAALFDVIVDVRTVEPKEAVEIDLAGAADAEDLFVRFLSELLFLHDARDWLFRGFRPRAIEAERLSGEALGERYDAERHAILRQVKAVTYHHLRIEQGPAGWTARVVLDL